MENEKEITQAIELLKPQEKQELDAIEWNKKYDKNQIDLIRRMFCKTSEKVPAATDEEVMMFSYMVKKTGLDPATRQIYFWKEKEKPASTYTGIDGMYLIAERTGLRGGEETFYCDKDLVWKDILPPGVTPYAAKVFVFKYNPNTKMMDKFEGLARFNDYNKGTPTWNKFPYRMIEKCAAAQAYRKAYPQDLSNLYISEEMGIELPDTINVVADIKDKIVDAEFVKKEEPKKEETKYDVIAKTITSAFEKNVQKWIDQLPEKINQSNDLSVAQKESLLKKYNDNFVKYSMQMVNKKLGEENGDGEIA